MATRRFPLGHRVEQLYDLGAVVLPLLDRHDRGR
jgi:hypothetical protein